MQSSSMTSSTKQDVYKKQGVGTAQVTLVSAIRAICFCSLCASEPKKLDRQKH